MKRARFRLFAIIPEPCGHVHGHLSEIYSCLLANGTPGFRLVEDLAFREIPGRLR